VAGTAERSGAEGADVDAGSYECGLSVSGERGVSELAWCVTLVRGEADEVVCVEFAVLDGACGVGSGAVGASEAVAA